MIVDSASRFVRCMVAPTDPLPLVPCQISLSLSPVSLYYRQHRHKPPASLTGEAPRGRCPEAGRRHAERLRRCDPGSRRRAGAAAGRRGGCAAARVHCSPPNDGGRRRGGVLACCRRGGGGRIGTQVFRFGCFAFLYLDVI